MRGCLNCRVAAGFAPPDAGSLMHPTFGYQAVLYLDSLALSDPTLRPLPCSLAVESQEHGKA